MRQFEVNAFEQFQVGLPYDPTHRIIEIEFGINQSDPTAGVY